MHMTDASVSVLVSVYEQEDPDHFRVALESIAEQTVRSDEVVVVAGGPLSDSLESVLSNSGPNIPNSSALFGSLRTGGSEQR